MNIVVASVQVDRLNQLRFRFRPTELQLEPRLLRENALRVDLDLSDFGEERLHRGGIGRLRQQFGQRREGNFDWRAECSHGCCFSDRPSAFDHKLATLRMVRSRT